MHAHRCLPTAGWETILQTPASGAFRVARFLPNRSPTITPPYLPIPPTSPAHYPLAWLPPVTWFLSVPVSVSSCTTRILWAHWCLPYRWWDGRVGVARTRGLNTTRSFTHTPATAGKARTGGADAATYAYRQRAFYILLDTLYFRRARPTYAAP